MDNPLPLPSEFTGQDFVPTYAIAHSKTDYLAWRRQRLRDATGTQLMKFIMGRGNVVVRVEETMEPCEFLQSVHVKITVHLSTPQT